MTAGRHDEIKNILTRHRVADIRRFTESRVCGTVGVYYCYVCEHLIEIHKNFSGDDANERINNMYIKYIIIRTG